MRTAIIFIGILLIGCVTYPEMRRRNIKERDDMVVKVAKFESGCKTLHIANRLVEKSGIRYILVGCGKRLLYSCVNTQQPVEGSTQALVVGPMGPTAECKRVPK